MNIQILNPEVKGILDQLVKLNLIRITPVKDEKLFENLLLRIREGSENELSIEAITKEVELVRQKRFDLNQKPD